MDWMDQIEIDFFAATAFIRYIILKAKVVVFEEKKKKKA